ncbi:hypothetical protein T06_5347 [Trichinella sp. T6]|nr:hypothetical protein T06_5347 [Trichinella sp. T6]
MIVGERGAANEQWRFQYDDRRRKPLKMALYRRIEDKRRHHKDKGVRRVTLHDATLTISNDQSPYFHSSPFPLPVAVPGACRLARIPAMGAQASYQARTLIRTTKRGIQDVADTLKFKQFGIQTCLNDGTDLFKN